MRFVEDIYKYLKYKDNIAGACVFDTDFRASGRKASPTLK